MRLRLVVVGAFLAMAVVPAVFAYTTGVLPGPTQASAESATGSVGAAHPVATLAWPKDPPRTHGDGRRGALGAAGSKRECSRPVVLQRAHTGHQPGPRPLADRERRRLPQRVREPDRVGDVGRAPRRRRAAHRGLRCGHRAPLDRRTGRPRPHGRRRERDLGRRRRGRRQRRRPRQQLADRRGVLHHRRRPRPRCRRLGLRADWLAGAARSAVWAGSYHGGARHKLAAAGTAIAIDGDRVVWAAGGGKAAVVAWDRGSRRTKVLCRVAGSVSSLVLSHRYAAWITTSDAAGPQPVWSCDFAAGEAGAVEPGSRHQAGP